MSKASDFSHGFASNLPIEGIEWSVTGKKLALRINNDNINTEYEISLNITKSSNKAEIWSGGHFVARCGGDNQNELSKSLTKMIIEEVEAQSTKEAFKEANTGLCDYITSDLEAHGFVISHKVGNEDYGSYLVTGKSGYDYQLKATYRDSKVTISKINENRDVLKAMRTFDLSNPNVEVSIRKALVEIDQQKISDATKNRLLDNAKERIINGACEFIDREDDWSIDIDGGLVVCETGDEAFKIKFRITNIIFEEIK